MLVKLSDEAQIEKKMNFWNIFLVKTILNYKDKVIEMFGCNWQKILKGDQAKN